MQLKTDLLVLSDGWEFDIYLELARQLRAVAQKKGLRVVLRPHPLDRTRVASLPGTQMFGVAIDADMAKYLVSRTPLGRLGTPADVADLVAFLASSGGRWVTGEVIAVSGGVSP